jgi:predicted RNA-binding Zn-ribbon protein involved in translation (DUF1610 family)
MGECYLCGRMVDERDVRSSRPGSPMQCPDCGAFLHESCVKDQGYAEYESGGILSSAKIHVECPACGAHHTDDPDTWR